MITTLKRKFNLLVGFSDHSPEIYPSIAAVSFGVCVIEKHFTLDKNMYGPDHKASLNPKEMKTLVYAIRNIEKALGDGIKKIYPEEEKARLVFQHSIVSAKDIQAGEIITSHMLTTKRPGKGLKPSYINQIIGKRAKREIKSNTLISLEDLE